MRKKTISIRDLDDKKEIFYITKDSNRSFYKFINQLMQLSNKSINNYKKFDNYTLLEIHKKIHLKNEKPFKCKISFCGKSYFFKCRLLTHLRTHYQIKPYKCNFYGCGKSFNESGNLKIHKTIHTGQRPYFCHIKNCNKSFRTKGNLRDHIFTHFDIKERTCRVCYRILSVRYLKLHYKNIHKIDFDLEEKFKKNLKNISTFMNKNVKQNNIVEWQSQTFEKNTSSYTNNGKNSKEEIKQEILHYGKIDENVDSDIFLQNSIKSDIQEKEYYLLSNSTNNSIEGGIPSIEYYQEIFKLDNLDVKITEITN